MLTSEERSVVVTRMQELIVHLENLVIRRDHRNIRILQSHASHAAPVPFRMLPPCIVDQDPPHRFRRRAKEMPPILKAIVAGIDQPQPHLMHQCRGLQGLPRLLLRQARRRQLPKYCCVRLRFLGSALE